MWTRTLRCAESLRETGHNYRWRERCNRDWLNSPNYVQRAIYAISFFPCLEMVGHVCAYLPQTQAMWLSDILALGT